MHDDRPPFCLERRTWEAPSLLAEHPPRFGHPHKRAVFALLRPSGAQPVGEAREGSPSEAQPIVYSRWATRELPERVPARVPAVEVHSDVFDYRGPSEGVWHANFADPSLFVAYGSSLLAQDELQALEHPLLGAVREALLAEGLPAVTKEHGAATPVLVTGVPRQCALDTAPTLERPLGLYGNRFAAAPFDAVRAALRVFDAPRPSNVLAMAAPAGGVGRYRLDQLATVLSTAFAAFAAASDESRALWPGAAVEVRTGFWGCGAFGGNRTVMVALQLLAARLAGLDRLAFYTVTQSGTVDFEEGTATLEAALAERDAPVAAVLQRLLARGLQWGVSDGN